MKRRENKRFENTERPARPPQRNPRRPAPAASNAAPSHQAARPSHRGEVAVGGSQKLHKVLAQAGLGSRREMEQWIAAGRITVNGKVAGVGERVLASDQIKVGGRPIRMPEAGRAARVLLYHKPDGEIVTREDPEGRVTVFANLPRLRGAKWLSVGRLDVNTSGLLIFTTSGDLANRMSHPRFEVEREYAVRILGQLSTEQTRSLMQGITLEDGPARCLTLEDAGGEGSNHWYRLVVAEGRNRLVRRLFEALGFTVSRLMRVRFGAISLPPRLKRGQSVELPFDEVRGIERWLSSLQERVPATPPTPRASTQTRNHRPRSSAATQTEAAATSAPRAPARDRSRPPAGRRRRDS